MFRITVGEECPTDDTIILHRGEESKEYLIESPAWQVLSKYFDMELNHYTDLMQRIWDRCDEDRV